MSEINEMPVLPEPGSESDRELYSPLPVEQLTCGIEFLTDFWREKYLQEYIRNGGSKIKFVTGRSGSGKTHFLRLMASIAQKENYKTIRFSARDI